MTPQEIRESIPSNSIAARESNDCPNGTSHIVLHLGEIAAQLADLNAHLTKFADAFTTNGCIDVNVRER